jgi:hypothetical protein
MDWARVAIDTGGGDFEVGGLEVRFSIGEVEVVGGTVGKED